MTPLCSLLDILHIINISYLFLYFPRTLSDVLEKSDMKMSSHFSKEIKFYT